MKIYDPDVKAVLDALLEKPGLARQIHAGLNHAFPLTEPEPEEETRDPENKLLSWLMSGSKARTRIGRPYLVSPIWKNGVSRDASTKLPSG